MHKRAFIQQKLICFITNITLLRMYSINKYLAVCMNSFKFMHVAHMRKRKRTCAYI